MTSSLESTLRRCGVIVVKRSPTDEIDAELSRIAAKRAEALDEIIHRFVEIVGYDNRVDVLLARRFAASVAESLRPMIHK